MIDKKTIVMENYFKMDCDINTSIKQAYERGFNRAYEKCMSLIKSKQPEARIDQYGYTNLYANCCGTIVYPNGFNPQSNWCVRPLNKE